MNPDILVPCVAVPVDTVSRMTPVITYMERAHKTVNPDINPHSAKKAGVSITNSVVLVKE